MKGRSESGEVKADAPAETETKESDKGAAATEEASK